LRESLSPRITPTTLLSKVCPINGELKVDEKQFSLLKVHFSFG
jgi:hypothetical protein